MDAFGSHVSNEDAEQLGRVILRLRAELEAIAAHESCDGNPAPRSTVIEHVIRAGIEQFWREKGGRR